MGKKFIILLLLSFIFFASTTKIYAAGPRVSIDSVRNNSGYLKADVHSEGLLDEKIINGLQRGFTSMVHYRIQLWRKKRIFSQLVAERYYEVKLSYDVWNNKFDYETPEERRSTSFIEKVRYACSEVKGIPLVPIEKLEKDAEYFISVELKFEPISTEKYQELQIWLDGNSLEDADINKKQRRSGEKKGGKGRLFGILTDLMGFGDKVINVKSKDFTLADINTPPGDGNR